VDALASLAFTLRSRDQRGVTPDEVSVTVDGTDVTAACLVRMPGLHPANRADYVYTPDSGWRPGRHEVRVEWPQRLPSARWDFVVR
jgi:hypothetical protein